MVKQPHSGIYTGWLRHRRYAPRYHEFRYQVFMMYLDLSEIDRLFKQSRFWSLEGPGLAQFKRTDFYGNPDIPLDQSLRQRVFQETGKNHTGSIRLLANLRYFGYIKNPISTYYFFDEQEKLKYILAEVNNTPWDERHSYFLHCDPNRDSQHIWFNKAFHVSPFNPMEIKYLWRCNRPEKKIYLDMQNHREGTVEFDATLSLDRQEITSNALAKTIFRYPFMTLKVIGSIYWEALKLWLKGVPVYKHPKKIDKRMKAT